MGETVRECREGMGTAGQRVRRATVGTGTGHRTSGWQTAETEPTWGTAGKSRSGTKYHTVSTSRPDHIFPPRHLPRVPLDFSVVQSDSIFSDCFGYRFFRSLSDLNQNVTACLPGCIPRRQFHHSRGEHRAR